MALLTVPIRRNLPPKQRKIYAPLNEMQPFSSVRTSGTENFVLSALKDISVLVAADDETAGQKLPVLPSV